jgi:transposase
VRWRSAADLPSAPGLISSPCDPEARDGKQRKTAWTGDKVHVTDTCDDETPNRITDVTTTTATTSDFAVLPTTQPHPATRQLTPGEQLVDSGDVTSEHLLASRTERGFELMGPVAGDQSWQGRAGNGFAAARFVIDREAKYAISRKGSRASCEWSAQIATAMPRSA